MTCFSRAKREGKGPDEMSGQAFNKQTEWNMFAQSFHLGMLISVSYTHLDVYKRQDIEGSIHPLIKNAVLKGASVENFSEFLTEEQMNDSVFLNEIQKTSNSWVKTVHSITRMSNNISDGTALEEEQFWKNFNNALCELEKRLNSTEVQITLTILSSAKRFYITNSFTSDIGLLEKISETQGYTTFLSGLSLQSISVSTSVKDLSSVIDSFANEFKKLRTSQYPLDRTVPVSYTHLTIQ